MQSNWLNSTLNPVVHGDIALSINTQYNTHLDNTHLYMIHLYIDIEQSYI